MKTEELVEIIDKLNAINTLNVKKIELKLDWLIKLCVALGCPSKEASKRVSKQVDGFLKAMDDWYSEEFKKILDTKEDK